LATTDPLTDLPNIVPTKDALNAGRLRGPD
jgi:hypothetical protein